MHPIVYTHKGVRTFALYIHLKYITVHRTFSDTTVQLFNTISVPYACTLEQYTFVGTIIQYTDRQFTLLFLLFIPYWFTVYNGIHCTLLLCSALGTIHKYPVQYQYTMGKDWMHYCYYLCSLFTIYHIIFQFVTASFAYSCFSTVLCTLLAQSGIYPVNIYEWTLFQLL